MKRTVSSEALRAEVPTLAIKHWSARYNETYREWPLDDNHLDRARKVQLVRQQDQELLTVALAEVLLAEHNVQFSDTC